MTITASEALQRTIEHREIFHDEMLQLMRMIMGGEITPLMTAAILTGLRVKKETIGEITAAAQVMREFSTKVQVSDRSHLVDIVGTGGDGSHTFNISTASAFVAAAAGARVAKHGNRAVSSRSGSSDVIGALGIAVEVAPTAALLARAAAPRLASSRGSVASTLSRMPLTNFEASSSPNPFASSTASSIVTFAGMSSIQNNS